MGRLRLREADHHLARRAGQEAPDVGSADAQAGGTTPAEVPGRASGDRERVGLPDAKRPDEAGHSAPRERLDAPGLSICRDRPSEGRAVASLPAEMGDGAQSLSRARHRRGWGLGRSTDSPDVPTAGRGYPAAPDRPPEVLQETIAERL